MARFGSASLCQAKRMAAACFTSGEERTTESPSISALAGTKSVSRPMISNQLSGLPSREMSPSPPWSKVTRSLSPSTASDLNIGPE